MTCGVRKPYDHDDNGWGKPHQEVVCIVEGEHAQHWDGDLFQWRNERQVPVATVVDRGAA